jgi:hypothetical protein
MVLSGLMLLVGEFSPLLFRAGQKLLPTALNTTPLQQMVI